MAQNSAANSAHVFEEAMSTRRTAAMRGRGGSTPNKRGVSPNWTQRQNFFSAVSFEVTETEVSDAPVE